MCVRGRERERERERERKRERRYCAVLQRDALGQTKEPAVRQAGAGQLGPGRGSRPQKLLPGPSRSRGRSAQFASSYPQNLHRETRGRHVSAFPKLESVCGFRSAPFRGGGGGGDCRLSPRLRHLGGRLGASGVSPRSTGVCVSPSVCGRVLLGGPVRVCVCVCVRVDKLMSVLDVFSACLPAAAPYFRSSSAGNVLSEQLLLWG